MTDTNTHAYPVEDRKQAIIDFLWENDNATPSDVYSHLMETFPGTTRAQHRGLLLRMKKKGELDDKALVTKATATQLELEATRAEKEEAKEKKTAAAKKNSKRAKPTATKKKTKKKPAKKAKKEAAKPKKSKKPPPTEAERNEMVARCKPCERKGVETVAKGIDDIQEIFGWRYDASKPQAWCRACRSEASKKKRAEQKKAKQAAEAAKEKEAAAKETA